MHSPECAFHTPALSGSRRSTSVSHPVRAWGGGVALPHSTRLHQVVVTLEISSIEFCAGPCSARGYCSQQTCSQPADFATWLFLVCCRASGARRRSHMAAPSAPWRRRSRSLSGASSVTGPSDTRCCGRLQRPRSRQVDCLPRGMQTFQI